MNVCFCGIDGVGKSYYINRIYDILIQSEESVCVYNPMKEGKNIKALLDNIPQCKSVYDIYDSTLVSMAYALDLYCSMIKMDDNCVNLLHRGVNSCKIYADMQGADMNIIEKVCDVVPHSDLTIFMDVNPDTAFERILQRSSDISWKEEYDNLCIARRYFNCCYEVEQKTHRCLKIDCNNPCDENIDIILRAIGKERILDNVECRAYESI